MKCPKCGSELTLLSINGQRGYACITCIELDQNILSMTQCDFCGKYYFKLTNKICDCRQLNR